MNIQGLDPALCQKRNRIVARKEAVEGVPVRLLAGDVDTFAPTTRDGELPETMDAALATINAKLPEGAAELTADDVYIHYLEAANSNFIGDRYMFLGESTLRNIAADAGRGFAFMNSHRTGSLSQESELPFGKTFAGQYQEGIDELGKPQKRAMVAFYMLRGVKPNGESGPTTDDLHKMIAGGQVADVSVGLHGGEALCDVCSVNLRETDCAHAPGTRRGMSDEQISQQLERGVTQGRASYTLNDARCGEVSAVFDGAVPGAGVKKVMSLRQKGKLNHREWKEARAVFGSLLNGDLAMDNDLFEGVAEAVETGFLNALASVGSKEPAPGNAPKNTAPASTVTEPREPAATLETNQEGVKPMAEQIEPVADLGSAGTNDANEFSKLKADLAAMQAERDKLAERTAKLEADARNARFSAEVEGTKPDGVKWFGDLEAHKTMLGKLAVAFGEDSPEVASYIQQNRAFAAQMAESTLLKEVGSNHTGNEPVSALAQLQAKAEEIRLASPTLTKEQAFAQATQVNPALYELYVREVRGGR